jgi:hypothetical protein
MDKFYEYSYSLKIRGTIESARKGYPIPYLVLLVYILSLRETILKTKNLESA